MTVLASDCRGIARELLERGIFRTRNNPMQGFLLAQHRRSDGSRHSPFYIGMRDCIAIPDLRTKVVNVLASRINPVGIDQIVGVPEGALSFATLVADRLNKPLLVIRNRAKVKHEKFIGCPKSDSRVMIIEDVITTGQSLAQAATDLFESGMRIVSAWTIIDRQAGAAELMRQMDILLQSVMTIDQLLKFYEEEGLLPAKTIAVCRDYLADQ